VKQHSHVAQFHKAAIPLNTTLTAGLSSEILLSPDTLFNMQQYIHRRIDTKSSEFRLLRIEKSLDETSPINITLRHAQLDEEESQFNALSYAWGDESPTYEVHIDDAVTKGSFHVRRNLYDFFCAVPRTTDTLTEWIWIDQICIDQTHHAEKCHQVGQMGWLYSTAKATISWPGTLRTAQDVPLNGDEEAFSSFMTKQENYPLLGYDMEDPDMVNAHRLAKGPLHDLIRSTYWSRTWIIQEIALAQHGLVLVNDELWL
jgi:hypothetical protein